MTLFRHIIGELLKLRSLLVLYFCCTLAFANNPIVDKCKAMIASGSSTWNFSGMNLGNADEQTIEFVCQAIKRSPVKELNLSRCNIGKNGIFDFSNALENHPTLLRLDLSNNGINTPGAVCIADKIKGNEVLRSVNLSNNHINDSGAKFLRNLQLQKRIEFDLRGNPITVNSPGISETISPVTVTEVGRKEPPVVLPHFSELFGRELFREKAPDRKSLIQPSSKRMRERGENVGASSLASIEALKPKVPPSKDFTAEDVFRKEPLPPHAKQMLVRGSPLVLPRVHDSVHFGRNRIIIRSAPTGQLPSKRMRVSEENRGSSTLDSSDALKHKIPSSKDFHAGDVFHNGLPTPPSFGRKQCPYRNFDMPFVGTPLNRLHIVSPSVPLLSTWRQSPSPNPYKPLVGNFHNGTPFYSPAGDVFRNGLLTPPGLFDREQYAFHNFDTPFVRNPLNELPAVFPSAPRSFGWTQYSALNFDMPFVENPPKGAPAVPMPHAKISSVPDGMRSTGQPAENKANTEVSLKPKHPKWSPTDPINRRLENMRDSISTTLNMTNIDLGDPKKLEELIHTVKNSEPSITGLILYNCNITQDIVSVFVTEGIFGKLKRIYLNNNPMIGDEGVKILSKMLKGNDILTNLKLTNCNITDEGAKELFEVLKGNTSLRELGLRENKNITNISGEKLLNILPSTKIDCLGFDGCRITKSFWYPIKEIIKARKKGIYTVELNPLKDPFVLNLRGTRLERPEDMEEKVISVLNSFPTIETLNLQRCNIGDAGASFLAETLKSNTSLKTVNLDVNNIGDEGAWTLAEALKANTTLKELNLFCNNIGDESAQVFAEALKINTTLKVLNLGDNVISDAGIQMFTEALPSMHLEKFCYLPQK